MQSLLSLQKHVIYGPVKSRRLGKSLGINLLPKNSKVCSFDCIYCHYGRTTIKTLDLRGADYPRPSTVALELEKALKTLEDIEYITFSGNGEPTLHPDFPEIVDGVISLRNELAPNALTAVLTNSSMLIDEAIRRATQRLDFCFAKLDAGDKVTFKKINRPHADIMFEDIVNVLREMDGIIIQCVMIDGSVSNTRPSLLDHWKRKVFEISPSEVQIYSTDRPVSEAGVEKVPSSELLRIARDLEREASIKVRAFYSEKN